MKENATSDNILNEKLVHFNHQKLAKTNNKKGCFSILFTKIFPCLHYVDQLNKRMVFFKDTELNYTNVMSILDKICMARILKEEAVNLDHNNKTGRGLDIKQVIRILSDHEIELLHEDGTPVI